MSAAAWRTRATDHRCDCGYQISTSPPFPRCPMCGGDSWRLIAVTRQVLVRARKPREVGSEKPRKLANEKAQSTFKEWRVAERAAMSRVDPIC